MIKRLLLSLAVALATLAAGAQSQLVLSHAGTPSFFAINDLDSALTVAQANDTIFLPECNIPGFKIDKPVTILGTGRNCIINGNIEIELKDPNQTVTNALLDGLNVWGSVNFKDNTTPGTYHVRYCRMNHLYAGKGSTSASSASEFASGIAENMPNLIVESCSIYFRSNSSEGYGMMLGPGTKSAFIFNSFIAYPYGSAPSGAVNYVYCNILNLSYYNDLSTTAYSYGNLRATFQKCIIKTIERYASSGINIFNSRIDNYSGASTSAYNATNRVNCYTTSTSSQSFPTTNVTEWTYPLDGETIGDLGGTSPYSDKPSLPTITQSSVEMDAENRLVKISLKIDGGAPEETKTPENPDQPENPENPETPETPAE